MAAVTDAELAAELRRRFECDQEVARRAPAASVEDLDRNATVVRDNTAWLKKIIDERGWPGWSSVGEAGANQAWLIAQHSDHDLRFQQRCLALLRDAVARADASAADLAYLEDRVRVAAGRPQLYGTQGRPGPDGQWTPRPIEDTDTVDERRAYVGLEPLADYVEQIRAWVSQGAKRSG